MTHEELKERCQKEGHAIMASMKSNGDVFVYINPQADEKEIMKSMILLATNVVQHINDSK